MSQNSETSSSPDAPKGTILIIDDNPTNLGVVAEYFELFGFTILIARDGESGLEKAHYEQPDLILLDVMMPGIDGFETCRRLKASEITQDIPVMFLTALANVEEKIKGFELGAVDYVVKPLHQKEVLARVTTHLRLRALTQELQQELSKRKRVEQELQRSLKEAQDLRLALDEYSSTNVTKPALKGKTTKKKQADETLEFLLNKRVKELNCLNEISREIAAAPPVPQLLQWVTERIPPAMSYPELCVTAIEYADQVYGVPEAIALPGQITHALRLGNTVMGRVYISYAEKRDFLDEESALIGGIAGRLGGYIESRHLLEQTKEAQAESELLYMTANQLIQAADPADLLEAASGYARSLGASAGQLMYLDPDLQGNPEWANLIAQWQLSGEPLAVDSRFYLPEFAMAKLWISQPDQPLLISDILTDQAVDPVVREMLVQSQVHSFGLLPLNIKGRWVGLLSFSWIEPYQFTKRDRRIFSALAQQAVAVVDATRTSTQMQAALAENQQRATEFEETSNFLDSIIENIPIGIFVKRAEDLSFVEWNPANEKLIGLKKEAVLGKNDSDFFSPDEVDFFVTKDREVLSTGKMLDILEETVETAHAGIRFLHTRKIPIFGADGKPKYLLGITEDITERKQAETTLQENQQLLRGFIDNSDAIIFVKDLQGRYLLVNNRFESLFHVDKHEVVGKTDLDIFPKELAKELQANDRKIIEAGVSSQVEESVVFDDGPHTFLSLKFPFLDAAGVPYALGGISTDITEKNRAEVEREQLLVEVEAAYRKYVRQEWNQFLGDQDQGGWHVEHQAVGQPIEPATQMLDELQDEVSREGKIKVVAGAGGNGHKVEPTIVAPIILRGQVIGTFSLQDIDPERQWSTEEMALVETVSEQLGLTIENLRLFDDTQKQATREQLTRQIADKMRAGSDVESIIQTGLTELAKAMGVSRSYVKLTPKE